MITADWDIQVAIDNRLYNDTNVTSRVTGIYDEVPDGTTFPYISYGYPTDTAFDTKQTDGAETIFQIDVWSRNGKKEVSDISGAIQNSLKEPLSVSGFSVPIFDLDFQQILDDPDGETKHGVLQYRILIYKEVI
jgi:hypothetical protein